MTVAQREQRRYALAISGRIVPQRERECSVEDCAKLIETAHILAADLGIILQE